MMTRLSKKSTGRYKLVRYQLVKEQQPSTRESVQSEIKLAGLLFLYNYNSHFNIDIL